MAYGTPANVRSHRLGRRRRRSRFRWGVAVTVAVVLAVVGLGIGYQQLLARACVGLATAQVAAPSSTAALLTSLAGEWTSQGPAMADGTCAQVVVVPHGSAQVATRLAAGWDVEAEPPPHVWVPEAGGWADRAAVTSQGAAVVPQERPSIARTPLVLAMPAPMADALGWPQTRLDPEAPPRWDALLAQLPGDQGWQELDQPWGKFRLGMTDPARDTAGMLTLAALLDHGGDGELSDDDLAQVALLHRSMTPEVYHDTTGSLLTELRTVVQEAAGDRSDSATSGAAEDDPGSEALLRYVSAFPALEQEVLQYNLTSPRTPLAAVYPDGTIEADMPYLILQGDWVGEREREVAERFLEFLHSDPAGQSLREAGFRDLSGQLDPPLTEGYGVVAQLPAPPETAPGPTVLATDAWTAISRPTNALIALDVSESMAQQTAGGEPRLGQVQQAATATVELFTDHDQVGVWGFATGRDGDLDYQSLVPLGQLSDQLADGRSRRDHLVKAIDGLSPGGGRGLYRTLQAAFDTVLANYDPEAANLVVVVTDGPDDPTGEPKLSLDELLTHVRTAAAAGDGQQQVRVVVVAFGEQPEVTALRRISAVTGGAVYHSPDGSDLVALLRTAVFAPASRPAAS